MDHCKCLLCGKTVGRLPLHLHRIHGGLTLEQYYRKMPEAKPVEETPEDQGNSGFPNNPVFQKASQFSWGEEVVKASMKAGLSKGAEAVSFLRIAHRSRRNFNELIGNVQFSFGSDGVAVVSINHRKQRDALLMRPGYYAPEEKQEEEDPLFVAAKESIKASKVKASKVKAVKTVELDQDKDTDGDLEAAIKEVEEELDGDEDEDEYEVREAELKALHRSKLCQLAKKKEVASFGRKSVDIIQDILDTEFEDVEE